MNEISQKFIKKFHYLCLISFITFGLIAIVACGGGGDGGDGGGGVIGNTASGTYTYNPGTGILEMTFTSSDFPAGCGPEVGVEQFTVDSITVTTMIWDAGTADEMTWTRGSGTIDDIVGTWSFVDDHGNTFEIGIKADGSVVVTGNIVDFDCAGGGENTASGTYTYNPGTGILEMTFTSSDFPAGCGPEVGVEQVNVDSITATTMIWDAGTADEKTWTRGSGTIGDIVGTWSFADSNGNTFEIGIKADGSIVVSGNIVLCEPEPL